MSEIGHIFATLAKAIVKIFFVGIICGVIGFGVIMAVAYFGRTPHTITTLDYIVSAVVAVLALYAGAVTVLMGEAVHAARVAVGDAAKEAGAAAHGAGSIVQNIEKEVEKHI